MNWDAIAAVGELIGSLTVIITVLYLAVQVKQSSRIAKSVSTNQSRTAVTDVIGSITSNTDAVKTYAAGLHDREGLEVHERIRFDLMIYQQLRVIETIFLEFQEGLMPEEVWESQWNGEKAILRTKGGRAAWEAQKTFVAKSFMEWVDVNLDRG
jgi:hypothetical protein